MQITFSVFLPLVASWSKTASASREILTISTGFFLEEPNKGIMAKWVKIVHTCYRSNEQQNVNSMVNKSNKLLWMKKTKNKTAIMQYNLYNSPLPRTKSYYPLYFTPLFSHFTSLTQTWLTRTKFPFPRSKFHWNLPDNSNSGSCNITRMLSD